MSINQSVGVLRIAAIVMTLAAVTFISVVPQANNDFWLQTKIGEIIFREHAIPSTLLFPFTEIQTAKFNAHEWLPSLFFFGLVSTVGEDSLPLVLGAAGLLLFGVAAWLAYRRGEGSLPLALLSGLVAVGVENFRQSLRPEIISLIILGIYWLLLENCRKNPSRLSWFGALLIVVIWSNTHGSFVLAPIIGGIYAIGVWIDGRRPSDFSHFASATSARQFAIFSVAALACTLVNPFGWDLLKFVFEFGNSSYINQNVIEWYSIFDPRLRDQRGLWIGVACASALILSALVRLKRLSAVDALLLFPAANTPCHSICRLPRNCFCLYLPPSRCSVLESA